MRTLLVLAVTLGLAAACRAGGSGGAPPPGSAASGPSLRVPGEYIVTLAPGADPSAIDQVFRGLGVKRVRGLGGSLYLLTIEADPGPERMDALRAKDPRIHAVQPNYVYRG